MPCFSFIFIFFLFRVHQTRVFLICVNNVADTNSPDFAFRSLFPKTADDDDDNTDGRCSAGAHHSSNTPKRRDKRNRKFWCWFLWWFSWLWYRFHSLRTRNRNEEMYVYSLGILFILFNERRLEMVKRFRFPRSAASNRVYCWELNSGCSSSLTWKWQTFVTRIGYLRECSDCMVWYMGECLWIWANCSVDQAKATQIICNDKNTWFKFMQKLVYSEQKCFFFSK